MISIAMRWCDFSNLKYLFTLSVPMFALVLIFVVYKKSRSSKEPLPPGPPCLPIVGNLPILDSNIHSYFSKLSKTYGAIMKVQLGSKIYVVLSSPSTAREVLKDHDAIFANRDVPDVVLTGLYGGLSMFFSSYGEHFRVLRKISIQHLLSSARLELQHRLRQKSTRDMVNRIHSRVGHPIKVYSFILVGSFHLFTSMLFGGTLEKEDIEGLNCESEYEEATDKLLQLLASLNVSDLFPSLSMFDVQGLSGKMKTLVQSYFDPIFDLVINRRLKVGNDENWNRNTEKDFLQVLLQFKDQEDHDTPITINHIKALLMVFLYNFPKLLAIHFMDL